MIENKQHIRQQYLTKRKALSEAQCEHNSTQICDKLWQIVLEHKPKVIHSYVPIHATNEPNVSLLWPNIFVNETYLLVTPKMVPNSRSLVHLETRANTQFIEHQWGIREANTKTHIPTEQIDMVWVPMLACDTKGNRIGYGKGFYDAFLQSCKPTCIRIGISFFEPLPSGSFEPDPWDTPLNALVTPGKVYWF